MGARAFRSYAPTNLGSILSRCLDRSAACEQVDDQNNERNHEQQMYKTATDSANHTDQPKN
jgi:hypothetical protein